MKKKTTLIIMVFVLFMAGNGNLRAEDNKIQFELTGNYIFANPEHLNYFTVSESEYLDFWFDKVYSSKSEDGSLKSIKSIQILTTRLKYTLTSKLKISLGLSYLWKKLSSPYNVFYTRNENWRRITDELDYTQMNTKLTGFIPSIGLHYQLPLSKTLGVELSLAGGPLFISIDHDKTVVQNLTSLSEQTFPIYTSEKNLHMDGTGTGVSLTGGVKLQKDLAGSLGIFMEGGYSWQRVNNISGNGREFIDGYQSQFNGEWGLVKEQVNADWGQTELIFPTNNWAEFKQKSEDFILDLSGFYISIGFYINL